MTQTRQISMNIKPEALTMIKNHMKNDHQIVLLALNDGSTKYSKMGGTCTIGANFQFVIMDVKDPEYDIKIANNANLNLYTAEAETGFLEDNLVLNATNATLSLSDDSGVIDGGVTVSEYEPSAITKQDMIEGKTC